MDNDNFYYDYYVTYKAIDEDKALVIRSQNPITTADAISSMVVQLAEKEQVETEQIFLYGFSLMNIFDGMEVYEDKVEDQEETSINTIDQDNSVHSIYVFSIHYKQNGELKELQNAINIDITADDSTKLELAESLVRDQDSVSDEDDIEIVEITKLADGNI